MYNSIRCLAAVNFLLRYTYHIWIVTGAYMDIGKKLKELRIQKDLTQEELADRTELSKGFISQLENNNTSPSISTLTDILQCLGTGLSDFFSEPPEEQIVFRKSDFFVKEDFELRNQIEWIIPNAQKNMLEPIRVTLGIGGSTYPDIPHEGEEFGYVLSGHIRVHLGRHTYSAAKGDTFYFTPNAKHYIEAVGQKGASFIWISTPPNF